MRITGGEFRGRILKVPKSDAIRPTQDRVREAFFNMVAFELAGASFLDLFAGSGAVGIEALSRGARAATMVELNRRHLETLSENLLVATNQVFKHGLRNDFTNITFQKVCLGV